MARNPSIKTIWETAIKKHLFFHFVFAFGSLTAFYGCEAGDKESHEQDQYVSDAQDDGADIIGADAEITTEDAAPEETQPKPEKVRFIHFSDLHYEGVWGDVQGENLLSCVAKLNSLDFPADMAVATGDLLDYLTPGMEDATKISPLHLLTQIMNGLDYPWYFTMGNHDYYYKNDPLTITADKKTREDFYSAVLESPLFYSFELKGVKFIMLNSMDGHNWNLNAGLLGSFSDEQLEWLDKELDEGAPSLLFFHHPPDATEALEGGKSLCKVLEKHKGTVKGMFNGHLHQFRKNEFCGVASYLVGNASKGKPFYALVEYDPDKDVITIVNEAELPYITPPEYECEPGNEILANPSDIEGTFQILQIENAVTDVPGLGQYVGDGLGAIPWLIAFDSYDAGKHLFTARLTFASRWGDTEGYLTYLKGAPCSSFEIGFNNPCSSSVPFNAVVNAADFLAVIAETPADPSWEVNVIAKDLWIEGKIASVAGVPVIESGLIHATLRIAETVEDVKKLIVKEYCAGKIPECFPGTAVDLPYCPSGPEAGFFEQIPDYCDLYIKDYSLRSALLLVGALNVDEIQVIGGLKSAPIESSDTPLQGFFEPEIFSADPGLNCAAQ